MPNGEVERPPRSADQAPNRPSLTAPSQRLLGRTARSGAYHAYHDANNRRPECKPKQYAGSDRVRVRIRPQPQRGRRDDEQ